MTSKFAAFIIISLLAGCSGASEGTVQSTNGSVTVQRVTRFDDCQLYRINDGARDVYVARCGDDVQTSWDTQHPCGKGCVRTEHHQTITNEAAQ